MASDFETIGPERLRALVDDFVGRMARDVMIGFLFSRIDLARLRDLEYQHAAEHLGGPVRYEGRPLRAAHARHRILGGQFARRREILRQTLATHAVPADVANRWLAHVDALRGEITEGPGSECA